IILVLAIGVLVFFIFNKDEKSNKENNPNSNNSVTDVDNNDEKDEANANDNNVNFDDNSLKFGDDFKILKSGTNYKEYTFDYGKNVNKGKVLAKLDNDVTVAINISDIDNSSDYLNFKFYINDNLVYEEEKLYAEYGTDFSFYTLGSYVIFNKNLSATDMRSDCIVVYDKIGNLQKKITNIESDNLEGMVVSNYDIKDGQLIIEASRYYHGPVVFVGGEQYNYCGGEEGEKDIFSVSLSESISVESEYHYYLKNGVLDLNNPEVKVKKTIKDLRKEDAKCIADSR
ncbi:MAG: hypothetical protein K2G03_04645, partial [Bacilli bacterium]|nr:hypothetical protein [Bacilli bacterium]